MSQSTYITAALGCVATVLFSQLPTSGNQQKGADFQARRSWNVRQRAEITSYPYYTIW
jgi:hypothetical protein